eukprot:762358-Prymnesium_polylepis.1
MSSCSTQAVAHGLSRESNWHGWALNLVLLFTGVIRPTSGYLLLLLLHTPMTHATCCNTITVSAASIYSGVQYLGYS